MTSPTLLTLPPHLLESIQAILSEDFGEGFPADLRLALSATVRKPRGREVQARRASDAASQEMSADQEGMESEGDRPQSSEQLQDEEVIARPTIDVELVERLSSWATSESGIKALVERKLGEFL